MLEVVVVAAAALMGCHIDWERAKYGSTLGMRHQAQSLLERRWYAAASCGQRATAGGTSACDLVVYTQQLRHEVRCCCACEEITMEIVMNGVVFYFKEIEI